MCLAQLHVGGVVAVGVDPSGRYLLIVSHSGRGVFDITTWQRVARDVELAYPVDGRAEGIGPLAGQTIPVKEIDYHTSMMTDAVVGAFTISYGESSVIVKSAKRVNVITETNRIRRQLEQAFEGNAWHGPSVREILEGIDARVATTRPVPDAHSIWEIVLHLVSTQRTILRRMDGDATAINLPTAEEWPAIEDPSETGWRRTVERLLVGDRELRERIAAFPPERLDEPLIAGGSSAYDNFHGYVQHNLYHAAQIGLLKKMQAASSAAAEDRDDG